MIIEFCVVVHVFFNSSYLPRGRCLFSSYIILNSFTFFTKHEIKKNLLLFPPKTKLKQAHKSVAGKKLLDLFVGDAMRQTAHKHLTIIALLLCIALLRSEARIAQFNIDLGKSIRLFQIDKKKTKKQKLLFCRRFCASPS